MAHEWSPGDEVGGCIRLERVIAQGGFGRVWEATDLVLDLRVAAKEMLLPHGLTAEAEDELRKRVLREARNAAKLRGHPNIVDVYHAFSDDDVPWVEMQLVQGRSLADQLADANAGGRLPPERAQQVARALLEALRFAHENGIVHRDIKPPNILLGGNGGVLLTDFGTAVHQHDTKLTQTGFLIGSLPYIAPERFGDGKDEASGDLFSLGVTLYEATEGDSPFARDTQAATIGAVLHDTPPPPKHAGQPLADLIVRLLGKQPEARPTAAEALAILDGRQPAVDRPRAGKSGRSGPTTGQLFAAIYGVAALIAVTVFAFGWGQSAIAAEPGDCIWRSEPLNSWSIEPCGGPLIPGRETYTVLDVHAGYAVCWGHTGVSVNNDSKYVTLCVDPLPGTGTGD